MNGSSSPNGNNGVNDVNNLRGPNNGNNFGARRQYRGGFPSSREQQHEGGHPQHNNNRRRENNFPGQGARRPQHQQPQGVEGGFAPNPGFGGGMRRPMRPVCKFIPNCKYGDQCRFFHPKGPQQPGSFPSPNANSNRFNNGGMSPTDNQNRQPRRPRVPGSIPVPCRYFPNCRFGDNCQFQHEPGVQNVIPEFVADNTTPSVTNEEPNTTAVEVEQQSSERKL